MNAGELRIGDWVRIKEHFYVGRITVIDIENNVVKTDVEEFFEPLTFEDIEPIPLSPSILEKIEVVEKHPHLVLSSAFSINLGRGRYLAINDCGTPNEIWFLTEREGEEVKSIITLRNYDYDGRSHVHQLQNLLSDLGRELEIKL
jgi:hypothetical protein